MSKAQDRMNNDFKSMSSAFEAAQKEIYRLNKLISITNSNWPHEKKMHEELENLKKEIEKLKKVVEIQREALCIELDCGDNSCSFANERKGMRTNGGCRCLRNEQLKIKWFILNAREALKKSDEILKGSEG